VCTGICCQSRKRERKKDPISCIITHRTEPSWTGPEGLGYSTSMVRAPVKRYRAGGRSRRCLLVLRGKGGGKRERGGNGGVERYGALLVMCITWLSGVHCYAGVGGVGRGGAGLEVCAPIERQWGGFREVCSVGGVLMPCQFGDAMVTMMNHHHHHHHHQQHNPIRKVF